MGVLHSFSVKIVYYDKTSLRIFYFHVTICEEPKTFWGAERFHEFKRQSNKMGQSIQEQTN